jgi:hypothetical protein
MLSSCKGVDLSSREVVFCFSLGSAVSENTVRTTLAHVIEALHYRILRPHQL